jgi:hypothetical protein
VDYLQALFKKNVVFLILKKGFCKNQQGFLPQRTQRKKEGQRKAMNNE